MKNEARFFDHEKGEIRLKALTAWKAGESISKIAESLKRSRETIYRWVKNSEKDFSSKSKRQRRLMDQSTHWKVIEAYTLLGKPSMNELSESLSDVYGFKFTASQLRRYLKKWNVDAYTPSPLAKLFIERRRSS